MHKSVFITLVFIFNNCFINSTLDANPLTQKPTLSIITSIYDGDAFIEDFLEDITKQTIFADCELILINANSPGNEEEVINKYLTQYSNIYYIRLLEDPGIYAVWNLGIKIASSDLICNANIDDRSSCDAFEKHVNELNSNPGIDLVYSNYYITEIPNETFKNNHYRWIAIVSEFSPKNLCKCLPGPRPVWRKSLHERFGLFDESFISSGDFEMWNRAVSLGAKFKKIEGAYTLYYLNPKGISSDPDKIKSFIREEENQKIVMKYGYLWR